MPNPAARARARRLLLLTLLAYCLVAGASVFAFGLLQQHATPRVPVHWGVLFAQFALLVLVIDGPLLVLALWFGRRLDNTLERAMNEALDRALPVMARLFIEHWNAERARGHLPGQTIVTVETAAPPHVHTEPSGRPNAPPAVSE